MGGLHKEQVSVPKPNLLTYKTDKISCQKQAMVLEIMIAQHYE